MVLFSPPLPLLKPCWELPACPCPVAGDAISSRSRNTVPKLRGLQARNGGTSSPVLRLSGCTACSRLMGAVTRPMRWCPTEPRPGPVRADRCSRRQLPRLPVGRGTFGTRGLVLPCLAPCAATYRSAERGLALSDLVPRVREVTEQRAGEGQALCAQDRLACPCLQCRKEWPAFLPTEGYQQGLWALFRGSWLVY